MDLAFGLAHKLAKKNSANISPKRASRYFNNIYILLSVENKYIETTNGFLYKP